LSKVDVYGAGSVGADSREEIVGFEAMGNVFKFLAVTSEEDGTSTRTITDANYITLYICRSVGCRVEGLVESAVSA
jgi:hypothetical protein